MKRKIQLKGNQPASTTSGGALPPESIVQAVQKLLAEEREAARLQIAELTERVERAEAVLKSMVDIASFTQASLRNTTLKEAVSTWSLLVSTITVTGSTTENPLMTEEISYADTPGEGITIPAEVIAAVTLNPDIANSREVEVFLNSLTEGSASDRARAYVGMAEYLRTLGSNISSDDIVEDLSEQVDDDPETMRIRASGTGRIPPSRNNRRRR